MAIMQAVVTDQAGSNDSGVEDYLRGKQINTLSEIIYTKTETNGVTQTNKKVRLAYVRIRYISYVR